MQPWVRVVGCSPWLVVGGLLARNNFRLARHPSRVDAKRLFYGDSGEAKRLFRRKPNGIPG
jgi:hypothetical protein